MEIIADIITYERCRDREHSPQVRRVTDSRPKDQGEVRVVRMIERGDSRVAAVKNNEAGDMQAWGQTESEATLRRRIIHVKLRCTLSICRKTNASKIQKKIQKIRPIE